MVIPDGHVTQKCCRCPATQVVHKDHIRRPTGHMVSRTDTAGNPRERVAPESFLERIRQVRETYELELARRT